MSVEIKLTFDDVAAAAAFLVKASTGKAEQPKAEQPKAEALDYTKDIAQRVLAVARRPLVGRPMVEHLFARMGVKNAKELKGSDYPYFITLLDLADAAEDEAQLQTRIAELQE